MYNKNRDISIQQTTLNDSILDLFQNLRINQSHSSNQGKIAYELLLLKVFNNSNSQLSHELTLAYLYCIKSDSFIQEMTNKSLDKTTLSKLRQTVMKYLLDGDKIHLIHILLCFIEFYMVKPSNAEFSTKIFTTFEIEKIDSFISKKPIEIALAKFHIKSIIGLVFSLSFNYQFSYTMKGETNLINQLINHIEKLVTCKDQFYNSYTSKQLFKVFTNAKGYFKTNKKLVSAYIRYCITDKAQSNVLKNILSASEGAIGGSCYYQTILILKWYNTLIKNKNETESYALTQFKYEEEEEEEEEDNNNPATTPSKRLFYFGNIKEVNSSLIHQLFCDSFNNFRALDYIQTALVVFIIELLPLFENNIYADNIHLLHSYLISIVYFNQFIGECEKISQIEINKEHYALSKEANDFKTQLTNVNALLSKSKAKLVAHFFYNLNIPREDIQNEIKTINDPHVLLCMLILIKGIYQKNSYFKQDINHIKDINALIIEQFFNEMVLHRYYNVFCFSYILETHHLYSEMPDKANYFTVSNMNTVDYSLIYIYHEMYKVMFMMKANTSIKIIIEFICKQYDGAMKSVYLPMFKYSKTKLNYLVLNLQLMAHIIAGESGEFTLMYCSSCFNKLNSNRGIRLSKYLFQCSKCKQYNFMTVFEEEYMNHYAKGNAIQTDITNSASVFVQKLSLTLDLLDGFKRSLKYKVIALITQFIVSSQFHYKNIVTQEIRDKLLLIQNKEITLNEIKQMKDFSKKKKMLKWYSKCQDFIIE